MYITGASLIGGLLLYFIVFPLMKVLIPAIGDVLGRALLGKDYEDIEEDKEE